MRECILFGYFCGFHNFLLHLEYHSPLYHQLQGCLTMYMCCIKMHLLGKKIYNGISFLSSMCKICEGLH